MQTVIITIKPPFPSMIRSGKKTTEMRKTFPKCSLPFKCLVVESGSGGKIVCEFIVRSFRKTPVKDLPIDWVYQNVGITKAQAYDYARGKDIYLWNISDVVDYCSTKGYKVRNISEFGLKRAPQSWIYAPEVA